MSGPDLEKLLSSEQKAEVVRSAIVKASDGELDGSEFSVRYDRRYAFIFEAVLTRTEREDRPDVSLTFSISPVSAPPTFFQNSAREAARAILDILHRRITCTVKPRPSDVEIVCPCCAATVRVVGGRE